MVQDSAKVAIEREYEVICDLSNGVVSSDLELSLPRVSRSRYFSNVNISKTVHFRDKVTTEGYRQAVE